MIISTGFFMLIRVFAPYFLGFMIKLNDISAGLI